jgi:hypothetical protein
LNKFETGWLIMSIGFVMFWMAQILAYSDIEKALAYNTPMFFLIFGVFLVGIGGGLGYGQFHD